MSQMTIACSLRTYTCITRKTALCHEYYVKRTMGFILFRSVYINSWVYYICCTCLSILYYECGKMNGVQQGET